MNFWDTVAGQNLAETLTRELPKISDALSPKKQRYQLVPKEILVHYLETQQEEGKRIVSCVKYSDWFFLVISE